MYYKHISMFQINIQMKLKKTDDLDKDPREDEILNCPIVDRYSNLKEFFKTDYGERYKCTTLSDAHCTTHALLGRMFNDLSTVDDID